MNCDRPFPRRWPILGLTLGMLASPTKAQWESALSFDGVDDQVQVANAPGLALASQVTFEAWIRPHTSKCNTILSRGHGGENQATDFIFQVGYNGAGNCNSRLLAFLAVGGAWDVSTSTVPLNQWTHVAVTFDGVMKRFYINGALDRAVNRPGQLYQSNDSFLYIGRQGSSCNCNFLEGELDEVRIWNVARSGTEIQAGMARPLTGAEAGLVAYWQFDEGQGDVTQDGTGHGHDGVLVRGPSWIDSTLPLFPSARTMAATGVAFTGARLHGAVNPNGEETGAWFEWGETIDYGNQAGFTEAGSGTNDLWINVDLTGLTPGATYHFRLAATNSLETAYGEDRSFSTLDYFSEADVGLPPLSQSAAAWGDYNNDGTLDLLLQGRWPGTPIYINAIYTNNGNGAFGVVPSEWVELDGLSYGSVAWGDCDNDGDLDLVITGQDDIYDLARVYCNQGDGAMTNLFVDLPSVSNSSVAWGDCDNDGRLDILIAGEGSGETNLTRIYQNDLGSGGLTFTWHTNTLLPGITGRNSVGWGDQNNDGHLDLLLAGSTNTEKVTRLYGNTGEGTFQDLMVGLPGLSQCSVAWGDYDNDGDLDILLAGKDEASVELTRIYRNNGDSTFSWNTNAVLPGVSIGSVAWGDYDNDGDLDILLTGWSTLYRDVAGVYQNNGDGTFTDLNVDLVAAMEGSATWSDYDNDGDLDLLLSGISIALGTEVTLLYRNNCLVSNSPPSTPGNLQASVTGFGARLSWAAAMDAQTPAPGLTYNLRVGTTPGGGDIVSPHANTTTGWRRLPQLGNAQHRLFSLLTGLKPGVYYWSVQALDTAFAGGPFAEERTFYVGSLRILNVARTPDSQVHLDCSGIAGLTYSLQTSTNLVDWTDRTTVVAGSDGFFQCTDAPDPMWTAAFYRLRER